MLTALVLAGGSASVNKLLVALNLRENKTVEKITPKPPPDKAWVSVAVRRAASSIDAAEPINFEVLEAPVPSSVNQADVPVLLGLIQRREFWPRLRQYLWRDTTRVPMSGGREFGLDRAVALVVQARIDGKEQHRDMTGQVLQRDASGQFTPEPKVYKFGAGAIIDFVVTF
jgi:hypothetical protein